MTDREMSEIALRLHNERRRIKVVEERFDADQELTDEEIIDLRVTLSRIVVAISEVVEDMRRLEKQHT